MRRHGLILITVFVVAATVGACSGGGANGGGGNGGGGNVQDPGEAGVQALLAEEVAAVRANDMDRRYSLESPAFREACDRSRFGGGRAAYNGPGDWYGVTTEFGTGKLIDQNYAKVEVRDVQVKVEGTAAAVGFAIWAPGRTDKVIYHLSANYQATYLDGRWWKADPSEGGGLFAGITFC